MVVRRKGAATRRLAGALLVAALLTLLLSALAPPASAAPAGSVGAPPVLGLSAIPSANRPATAASQGLLTLNIAETPSLLCDSQAPVCPGGIARTARVSLQVVAPPDVTITYPAVQVVFLLETTLYDGSYDGSLGVPGREYCADGSAHAPCEESNGVPFFVANAGAIANSIASANPHSHVTFGLVDFFATGDEYDKAIDDGASGLESVMYHVDIGSPVTASQFQGAVASTFQAEELAGGWVTPGLNFGNNFLHSDSITALYGVLMGYGVEWTPDAHHVLVLIGSTAPRDPSYEQNYCVSSSVDWRYACFSGNPYSSGCEPSYDFGTATSPPCVGWTQATVGGANNSIAGLALSGPNCADSLGHRCTIDVIDLWTTPTDPYSLGWPGAANGGPGGPLVFQNVGRVLSAGCALASATGGSWDGPEYYSCGNGDSGDLAYVAHGPADDPDTTNPTLLNAFHGVGFGPLVSTTVATGANQSMFQFVPFKNIHLAPTFDDITTCETPMGDVPSCPAATYHTAGSGGVLTWNWSNVPSENVLQGGDIWDASFDVIAVGGPFGRIPVDSCTTSECGAAGSGSVGGTFTLARYIPGGDSYEVNQSFPVASVTVVAGSQGLGTGPTAPPPLSLPPPAPPGPVPISTPPVLPTGAGPAVPTVTVQALGAGFLGAGFTRVAQRNRPVAVGQANSPSTAPNRRKRGPPRRAVGQFV
jgi:hypothetical protein